MNRIEFPMAGKTLRISAAAENTIRVRISDAFAPTLFERYGIFAPDDENAGAATQSSVTCGELTVAYESGKLTVTAGKQRRTVTFMPENAAADRDYFCAQLDNMRPDRKHILGADVDRRARGVDFHRAPKSVTVSADGSELFYGLGEANHESLIQNGKCFLGRVIYTVNEYPVPFLMSTEGWGMLAATTFWHGVDVCRRDKNAVCWYLPDGEIDLYFFAGKNLPALLERFTRLTGRPCLLPKWAYGLTFIEQYKADQFQVMNTAAKLRELKLPCDMISLEPGWMAKEYDLTVNKKWNTDKFYICDWMRRDTPPRQGFTSALLRYGFKTELWLCSNYDFTAEEENRAGNATDFGFEPWFKHLKQFMNDGAAAFKLDPHQVVDGADEERRYSNGKGEPEMHNLCQTLYTKQMCLGAREHTGKRNMHHFCGGYLGAAQYGAANTGDSGGGIKTLAWVLNLGLSGVSDITCDMNVYAGEAMHYCFFTAWCQLNSWSGFSYPWWAGDEMQAYFTFYDRLRYKLLPYIYSAAVEAHLTGLPVARAMPLETADPECADTVNQYMFGAHLLVGAFTDTVWLPSGSRWVDYWTGKIYDGGQKVSVKLPEMRGGPLFLRCGAALVTQGEKQFTDCRDDARLSAEIYPGSADTDLWEDDGLSLSEARSHIRIACRESENGLTVAVSPREGGFEGMAENREFEIMLHCPAAPQKILCGGEPIKTQYRGAEGPAVFTALCGKKYEIVF